jgi:serine/threonine-protein kinase
MSDPQNKKSAAAVVGGDAWVRAKDLFGDIVTLPLDQRASALDARCGGDVELRRFVEALLASNDRLPGRHDESVDFGVGRMLHAAFPEVEPGRRFGAFAVVEEVGRGGMGVVYLAERDDGTVAQRVALKLVPSYELGTDASQRLARERRVLAALEHPNIARLIDAGEDPSGIPYFAMEFVRGAPITAYCDRHALPLVQRLRLFRQVCAAVQYAHANLIVHCDLKPGNILVTDDGLPKLLDFGIAATLGTGAVGESEATRFLSPLSAAPEQFLGQPSSVATDVYALGVLLCDLASGHRPFDAASADHDELRRRVLHDPPLLPSVGVSDEAARQRGGLSGAALSRKLAGDIDAIVGKALAKSPSQRYASVEQLDADIARHLGLRPVAARDGERGYRTARFLRRNAIAASFAALVVVLASVLIATLVHNAAQTERQNQQLAHERDQAQQRERQAQFERERAQQIADFMIGLFKASMPEQARGRDITARELLATGSRQLRGRLADQPSLKAAMLVAIADAWHSIDDFEAAEQAAREAADLRQAQQPPVPRDIAASLGSSRRSRRSAGAMPRHSNSSSAHRQRTPCRRRPSASRCSTPRRAPTRVSANETMRSRRCAKRWRCRRAKPASRTCAACALRRGLVRY